MKAVADAGEEVASGAAALQRGAQKRSGGIVTVTGSGGRPSDGRDWRYEVATRPPLSSSVPRRDHQPCRLAVPRVQPQPARCGLMLAERGIVVSYETVRRWCKKFGTTFADRLRRRRPRPGDKWHLDEVFIRIQGVQHYLWRAVDQDGVVLDILVQARRDAKAAKRHCHVNWSGGRTGNPGN